MGPGFDYYPPARHRRGQDRLCLRRGRGAGAWPRRQDPLRMARRPGHGAAPCQGRRGSGQAAHRGQRARADQGQRAAPHLPQLVSREGQRGMEYNAWGVPKNPPVYDTQLFFTRMLAGPMDYTPGIVSLKGRGDTDIRIDAGAAAGAVRGDLLARRDGRRPAGELRGQPGGVRLHSRRAGRLGRDARPVGGDRRSGGGRAQGPQVGRLVCRRGHQRSRARDAGDARLPPRGAALHGAHLSRRADRRGGRQGQGHDPRDAGRVARRRRSRCAWRRAGASRSGWRHPGADERGSPGASPIDRHPWRRDRGVDGGDAVPAALGRDGDARHAGRIEGHRDHRGGRGIDPAAQALLRRTGHRRA